MSNTTFRNALVSDAKFDQLENNLKRVSPNCDYFTNKKALPLRSLPKDNISGGITDCVKKFVN